MASTPALRQAVVQRLERRRPPRGRIIKHPHVHRSEEGRALKYQIIREPEQQARAFALVFDMDDEVTERLQEFARDEGIECASFTAIGAFRHATLAYWDWGTKSYHRHVVDQQVECASLSGSVSVDADGHVSKIHTHAVLGLPDGSAKARHLERAIVRPTLELFLTESATLLTRERDATGLALIRPRP